MIKHVRVSALFLLVLWLTPGVGLARQDVASPPSDAPVAPGSAAPSVPETPPAPFYDPHAPPVRERPHVALRLLAEVGAGLVTALPLGVLGGAIGLGACRQDGIAGFECLNPIGYGFVIGASLGFSTGVLWGGALVGNNGSVLGALSGPAGVLGAGLLIAAFNLGITGSTFGNRFGLATAVLSPLGAICSVIVYELTSSDEPRAVSRTASQRTGGVRLQPTLALSSQGALVGLGGTF